MPNPKELITPCKFYVAQAAITAAERGESVVRPECEDIIARLADLIRQNISTK
ncbi:hypothetical protein [Actinomyces bowdenii]|uniref:Uncharacterized protein n=1 Tax=Actinomyces bowdenii TaxID=131109 RepID=A0A853EJL8_9ACTO|nr:hypothetical protein [Actinomyces bowdenii]MBF0696048.1 hypothetical protein [Actinomyces bowdenii]NYS68221.1 hypothetical protein [Actinomyces bowdenii]